MPSWGCSEGREEGADDAGFVGAGARAGVAMEWHGGRIRQRVGQRRGQGTLILKPMTIAGFQRGLFSNLKPRADSA